MGVLYLNTIKWRCGDRYIIGISSQNPSFLVTVKGIKHLLDVALNILHGLNFPFLFEYEDTV